MSMEQTVKDLEMKYLVLGCAGYVICYYKQITKLLWVSVYKIGKALITSS